MPFIALVLIIAVALATAVAAAAAVFAEPSGLSGRALDPAPSWWS